MNEKDIAEIRRRFKPEKTNITHVCGCYVNDKKEIVSQFDQPFLDLPQEETEKLLAVLKRALSGTVGKNLIDIEFATKQVVNSEEHQLLTALRDTKLQDPVFVEGFYGRVIDALRMEGSYLILLAYDTYDVPFYGKDGEKDDFSSEVFSYVLCAVCPVKETKPALCYYVPENTFHNLRPDWLVSPPELGFMFPAFEDRAANIYGAWYYTRNTAENHKEFVDAVFNTEIPAPAEMQKETFTTALGDTLGDECDLEVVQAVHHRMVEMIEEHKADKESDPPAVSKRMVKTLLNSCGVSEEKITAFEERYDDVFGADATVPPQNIIDAKQFEVKTPDVTIKVNPERSDLVQTRIINGARYILIRADEGVEVNGVNIRISPEEMG